eukprot:6477752-Amphidinium_carterae.1
MSLQRCLVYMFSHEVGSVAQSRNFDHLEHAIVDALFDEALRHSQVSHASRTEFASVPKRCRRIGLDAQLRAFDSALL